VIDRPERLALDGTPMIPVLQHALIESGGAFDAVMLLQPTCPMRRAVDVDAAIRIMEQLDATSVITYVNVGANHPARMVVMLKSGYPHSFWTLDHDNRFANKQDLPDVYLRSGDVYLTTAECVMCGDWLGDKPRAYVMPSERHCNVDAPIDLLWAEFLLSREESCAGSC
jgi:CMP-N,N'-diacetyllegionaminic acid synthase